MSGAREGCCSLSCRTLFQTVYDQYFITLYNIVYTSLPVLAMGVFDQVWGQSGKGCLIDQVWGSARCQWTLPVGEGVGFFPSWLCNL